MNPSFEQYLQSWSAELQTQADRVRHLIGSNHWLSDGNHKELILKQFLIRHLPSTVQVARGFVVAPDFSAVSTEQDLLVIDVTDSQPLFQAGGLTVSLPDSVLAVISVKTQFRRLEFKDAVAGLRSALGLIHDTMTSEVPIWSAAFFFDGPHKSPEKRLSMVQQELSEAHHRVRDERQESTAPIPDHFVEVFGSTFNTSWSSGTPTLKYPDAIPLGPALAMADLLDHIRHNRRAAATGLYEALEAMESKSPPLKCQILDTH